MGIIDTLKETVGLIQKVDNIEIYRQMLQLQTQVMSLVEENRQLKERIAMREALTFNRNCYWRGEEGPFCSRCWDDEFKMVRLHVTKGATPVCPNCGKYAAHPDWKVDPIRF